jgi:hypothetical protein
MPLLICRDVAFPDQVTPNPRFTPDPIRERIGRLDFHGQTLHIELLLQVRRLEDIPR